LYTLEVLSHRVQAMTWCSLFLLTGAIRSLWSTLSAQLSLSTAVSPWIPRALPFRLPGFH
jgi:hypothetical protein